MNAALPEASNAEKTTHIALLSSIECDQACAQVFALREHWVQRYAAPFFTLGAASYLDGQPDNDQHYRDQAARYTPLLREHFDWLHQRLLDALQRHLQAAVILDESIGVPGFHIFLSDSRFERPVARIHVDRQYQNIRWPDGIDADFDRQLSITLSLRLPSSGGGLNVWPINSLFLDTLTREQRKELLARHRKPDYLPYELGAAVIHSGHLFHQIAPMLETRESEARITMQAHAFPCGDQWLLYW